MKVYPSPVVEMLTPTVTAFMKQKPVEDAVFPLAGLSLNSVVMIVSSIGDLPKGMI